MRQSRELRSEHNHIIVTPLPAGSYYVAISNGRQHASRILTKEDREYLFPKEQPE